MIDHESPVLYAVDLADCSLLPRLSSDVITDTFADALRSAGATVVQALSQTFPGAGLTCILILAESHAVLHTWPETGTVNIDIFSCTTRLNTQAAIAALGRAFGAGVVSVQEVLRADGHHPACAHRD
jgi:S-adenosylmethionine decarboxylase